MVRLQHRHFFHFWPMWYGWFVPRYGCGFFGYTTVPTFSAGSGGPFASGSSGSFVRRKSRFLAGVGKHVFAALEGHKLVFHETLQGARDLGFVGLTIR